MKIAEIETTGDRDDGWRDWTVVHLHGGRVSIASDYQSPEGARETWQDEGIGVNVKHLDWLIEALQEAKAMVKESDGPQTHERR